MVFGYIVVLSDGSRAQGKVETSSVWFAYQLIKIEQPFAEKVVEVTDITDYPVWDNCIYRGNARGHSMGFCTADACF